MDVDTVIGPNTAEVLAFENIWWSQIGDKEKAIQDRFGLSPVRYYQKLNQILESEDALKSDPVTVNRLLRIRTR
ncbi:DUF3263 domain-containing protein [Mycobacteroides abscessus]|uniref:Fis family transcriptional regulator n=1 Tax=Mycobacteroides abscessus subsp. abscessus TaxID=1185650 RepID=A0AB74FDK9_9MYCO|nr:DUF3263 domain-containing protein [Mycobacteroides abscessus]KNB67051.1 hypothetical protein MAUC95_07645 [Mycobacteroides abscessus]MBE5410223.1 hypothetical protein [Mycobacteroides abscessus]MBE5427910.1 hypothetical protein [Mycobacteroides abscessus]MBE5489547.1 hypothetical protein [Mycobacteroides abscessus]MBE5507097.1 hypothetical protein [Mycobacteroides abscessus]